MKSPDVSRMLQIMVAAGWSRRDIVRLCHELSSLPLELVEDAIDETFHLHKIFNSQLDDRLSNLSHRDNYLHAATESYNEISPYSNQGINSDLYYKVKQLLIDELGLSSEDVVRLLSENLDRHTYVPPLSKKSLSNWLDRLSAHVPPSEILYAATVVFNKFKDRKGLDWNVRR